MKFDVLLFVIFAAILPVVWGGVQRAYLAVCIIAKDEHDYISEWIEYHRRMGVQKIYLYDHNSSVPMLDTIRGYVASKLVDYVYADFHDSDESPQISAYNLCLQNYAHLHQFIAFIDSDDFIVVVDKTMTIPEALLAYEAYGGVALNRMGFGSSGVLHKPRNGVIANYYKCHKTTVIKSIVNTKYGVKSTSSPNAFVYVNGFHAVDTSFLPVPFHLKEPSAATFDVMYINHYHTRSMSEYLHDLARGRGATQNKSLSMELFREYNHMCHLDCPILNMPSPGFANPKPTRAPTRTPTLQPSARPTPEPSTKPSLPPQSEQTPVQEGARAQDVAQN